MQPAKEINLYPVSNNVKENKDMGFIPIYRSIKSHWVWKESRVKTPFEAWVDLLLRASHEDQKEPVGIDFIVVKRGQVLTSQLQLSKDWFWSRKKVCHFLNVLQKDGMAALETTTKWSMITICNYAVYQDRRTTKAHQKNNNGTSKEHIQPLEPLEQYSTPPVFKFSNRGFFDRQLKANEGKPELDKYRKLVEFLHELDEDGEYKFKNVLSLAKQISFKDYLGLKATEKEHGLRNLKEVLEAMENKKDLNKDYKNVYLTANAWLKNEFKK
jgi:hypothetical protein